MNKENQYRKSLKPQASKAQVPKKTIAGRSALKETSNSTNLPQKLSENVGDKGSKPRPQKQTTSFSNLTSLFQSPKVSKKGSFLSDRLPKLIKYVQYPTVVEDREEVVTFDEYLDQEVYSSLRLQKTSNPARSTDPSLDSAIELA